MFFTFHYFNLSWNFYKFIFSVFCFYNNIFFSWCCCIDWSFIVECYSIWVLFWINTLRCVWLFFRFIYWHILCLRFYNHYFCRNFRNDFIPNFCYYNDIFFSRCCCVYWSFISKLCIFREGFRVNTSFNSWLFFILVYWYKLWITFYHTYSCRYFCNRITIFVFYNDIDCIITRFCSIYRSIWIIFKC